MTRFPIVQRQRRPISVFIQLFYFVHLEESGETVLIWHFKLLLLYKSVLLSIFVPIIPLYIYGNGSRDSLRAYVRAWKKNSLSDSVRSKDGDHKSRRIPTTVSSLMDQAIIISLAFILTFDNCDGVLMVVGLWLSSSICLARSIDLSISLECFKDSQL